jgi:hypothetical protein
LSLGGTGAISHRSIRFSKKLGNLIAALALWLAYNFWRIHGALRITPAMTAGVSDRVWELSELVA